MPSSRTTTASGTFCQNEICLYLPAKLGEKTSSRLFRKSRGPASLSLKTAYKKQSLKAASIDFFFPIFVTLYSYKGENGRTLSLKQKQSIIMFSLNVFFVTLLKLFLGLPFRFYIILKLVFKPHSFPFPFFFFKEANQPAHQKKTLENSNPPVEFSVFKALNPAENHRNQYYNTSFYTSSMHQGILHTEQQILQDIFCLFPYQKTKDKA